MKLATAKRIQKYCERVGITLLVILLLLLAWGIASVNRCLNTQVFEFV